jgi:pimeloyl-ACP methyl ester carboxylesterase
LTTHEVLSRDAIDRMVVTAHRIEVPLDWSRPDASETMGVFAREVVAAEKADDKTLPTICWLQGGPGSESPFPQQRGSWLEQLLTRYRVVLLDQRGTGLSTPIDARALPRHTPAELAEYLRCFRADSIVRYADRIRSLVVGEDADWHLFGQSFGGFCALTYLSFLPEHLSAVIITGGFAPIMHDAESIYRALAERVAERNAEFHSRFPQDSERIRRIIDHLESNHEVDSLGRRLSSRRFLTLGIQLGNAHGAAELHGVIERAANDLNQLGVISGAVHERIAELMAPATNPIYTTLQEACYAQGRATAWAAARVISADPRYQPDARPVPCFTGEMVFPWMFAELAPLRPLREAAELVASYVPWPALYDIERLRANRVPVIGTVYWGDPYVDRELALETARLVGNCEVWITNEYEHAAYRIDPRRVAERLFAMLDQRRARG